MKKRLLIICVCILGGVMIMQSCKKEEDDDDMMTTTPTLYDRVGGTAMVDDPANPGTMIEQGRLTLRSVVDSSIFVIAADPNMTPFFGTLLTEVGAGDLSGLTILSKNLTDFLCSATGATNTDYLYTGLSMADAHDPDVNSRMGMKAGDGDFDNFIADVAVGLGQNGVTDAQLISDLVDLLETTRADIVQM
ncbi:MAG: group 1 truncated hemoglobin [Chitinophagales bacterium]